MAASLYRKYRPQRFSELIGQEHVARALQNALSEDRLAHAYLFSGTRGTGKTSTARILGAVLNCKSFVNGFPTDAAEIEPCGECESCVAARSGNSFDVIELDAASNNGVEDMRDLIEKVSYTSAAGGTKVYIIDEVHELTGRASNALLKTLEEPPEHVVFILATTNPEKVLPTIRSRTQHFEFVSLPEEKLFNHARDILSWEERELDDDALHFVVRKGAGSVRDMLSYLDQVLALDVSTLAELEDTQASVDSSVILELILAASSGDVAATLSSLHELSSAGKEPRAIVENIISVARDCLVTSLNPGTSILLSNHADIDELKNIGDKCGVNFLRQFILRLGKAVADMRGTASLNPLLTVEIALLSSMTSSSDFVPGAESASGLHAPTQRRLRDESAPEHIQPASTDSVISRKSSAPVLRTTPKAAPAQPAVEEVQVQSQKPATLGSLKKVAPEKVLVKETVVATPTPAETATPSKKLTIDDVTEAWPKVVMLLSPASQASIKKVVPSALDGDVLTFSGPASELDAIKARFKKDASIIRGFLESLLNTTFRFQIVEGTGQPTTASEPDEPEDESKMMEESQEYNPVDTVLSMFSGEVVPEN